MLKGSGRRGRGHPLRTRSLGHSGAACRRVKALVSAREKTSQGRYGLDPICVEDVDVGR